MSNLKVAKDAIKAELDHARQGVAYYQSKIASLEEVLARIGEVGTGRGSAETSQEDASKKRRGRKAGAKRSGKLPATGRDFWLRLLGPNPMTAPEIYRAAIESIGTSLSKEEAKKLAQRQANALSVLSKTNIISSTGTARARQYFKQP